MKIQVLELYYVPTKLKSSRNVMSKLKEISIMVEENRKLSNQ